MLTATKVPTTLRGRPLLVVILLLFADTPQALALATEHFGNEPVPQGWGFSKEVLALANLKSRVYWYEVNGDPTFFYRGDTKALNKALAKLAAIPGARPEVVLLPGPGKTKSLGGEKEFLCDWKVHAPSGLYAVDARQEKGTNVFTKVPTMTVHVTVDGPAKAVDAKQLQRWIAELDADAFPIREVATRELEKLANAAGPALRKARETDLSPEKRRRIDRLLL